MFDGSQMEYDQNVECTRRVVEAAHGAGVSVEGEIGTIGETEDYLNGTVRDMVYTSPELARRFVEDTGVDAWQSPLARYTAFFQKDMCLSCSLGF